MIIENGVGNANKMRVDGRFRGHTRSVTQTEQQAAVDLGNAYNLNTGTITLTDGSESAIMYLKNNELVDFHLSALAIGVGVQGGTVSEVVVVTMVRNPTSVSFSTNIDQNQNRNFGSSKTLAADVFKGAQGATITGGNDIAQFFMNGSGRLFAGIDFAIPPGSSVALKIDLNDTSGGIIYGAMIGFIADAVEKL